MKVTIDTEKKTIELLEEVSFGKLYQFLESLFPGGEWKEYELKRTVRVKVEKEYYPTYPFTTPFIPYVGQGEPFEITYEDNTGGVEEIYN